MTRRFELLGDPVAQSISPPIHAAVFTAWGEDARYVARRVTSDEVEASMRRSGLAGGNVTVPHKLVAAAALDLPTPGVEATGACNCWWRLDDGRLAGDNTDVGGLLAALEQLGFEPVGARVLLLGAGGAARAAVRALGLGGASTIEILNRTRSKAEALRDEVGTPVVRPVRAGEVRGAYDLVLNATRLGLAPGDPLPLDLAPAEYGAAYDMVYRSGDTPWVRHARSLGIRAASGVEMLVAQAALSLERWFPDRTPPLDLMRETARTALEPGVE